jgi:broad specificity phosphatase PhoE
MARTIETANHINGVQERWKALNEIDVGACDGMTYKEIREGLEHYLSNLHSCSLVFYFSAFSI